MTENLTYLNAKTTDPFDYFDEAQYKFAQDKFHGLARIYTNLTNKKTAQNW